MPCFSYCCYSLTYLYFSTFVISSPVWTSLLHPFLSPSSSCFICESLFLISLIPPLSLQSVPTNVVKSFVHMCPHGEERRRKNYREAWVLGYTGIFQGPARAPAMLHLVIYLVIEKTANIFLVLLKRSSVGFTVTFMYRQVIASHLDAGKVSRNAFTSHRVSSPTQSLSNKDERPEVIFQNECVIWFLVLEVYGLRRESFKIYEARS